jgi:hypothetical protein
LIIEAVVPRRRACSRTDHNSAPDPQLARADPPGHAGTSASGFAAEEAVAMLDYVEDLYRDWNDGARSGGAARRIDDEFERVRRELGDLPGIVSDELRLRTMLAHLRQRM